VSDLPDLPLKGRCQCGDIRYEITRPPLMIYNCHCTNCQKISGSAFSTPMAVMEDSLRFTQGTPRQLNWQSDVGSTRFGLFCGNCGNRIAHGQTPTRGILSVRSGTLEDAKWVRPVGDIWTTSAQEWTTFSDDRLQYPKQPEDYSALVARFSALGLFPS